MKLSKLASPAGFALVLLLFLFLPFLSVSCEVPGMGSIGADYNGAQLAVGDDPEVEVPAELREMAEELPGGGGENSEPPPDPGVQVLAIIVGLVLLGGIATPLIPRVRNRLFGAAGVAVLGAALVVVTQVVAQSNLTSQLLEDAENLSDDQAGMPAADEIADQMIHSEVGFWLTLIGLLLLALINVGVVYKDKIIPKQAMAGTPAPGTAPPPAGAFTGAEPPPGTPPASEPTAAPATLGDQPTTAAPATPPADAPATGPTATPPASPPVPPATDARPDEPKP
jgi:hypothetical protein